MRIWGQPMDAKTILLNLLEGLCLAALEDATKQPAWWLELHAPKLTAQCQTAPAETLDRLRRGRVFVPMQSAPVHQPPNK